MEKRQFKIGLICSYSGLYGGQYTAEVISRTDTTVTFREYWIAEDTGKECHTDVTRNVEVKTFEEQNVQVERVQVWEYRGEIGYLYCIDESEIYDLTFGCEDEEEYFDDWDEKDYGPSNPWDAPGMKVSDFITGVSYW